MKTRLTGFVLALLLCGSAWAQAPQTVTIPSGSAVSTSARAFGVDASGRASSVVAAVIMPSAWTSARIAFQASLDGSTWYDVYDSDGARVTIAASASRWIELPMSSIWAARYVRLVSVDASGNPVNQAADRQLVIIVR